MTPVALLLQAFADSLAGGDVWRAQSQVAVNEMLHFCCLQEVICLICGREHAFDGSRGLRPLQIATFMLHHGRRIRVFATNCHSRNQK